MKKLVVSLIFPLCTLGIWGQNFEMYETVPKAIPGIKSANKKLPIDFGPTVGGGKQYIIANRMVTKHTSQLY